MQLYGRELLPFDATKQNALYASLDLIGLNSLAGVGWVEILSISEAWHWKPLRGDVGVANITIRTKRERAGRSMGEVLPVSSLTKPPFIASSSLAPCTNFEFRVVELLAGTRCVLSENADFLYRKDIFHNIPRHFWASRPCVA